MKHARLTEHHRYPSSGVLEDDEALDENTVLEQLETDLSNDEDYQRLRGIRNGVVTGLLLWAAFIGSAVAML